MKKDLSFAFHTFLVWRNYTLTLYKNIKIRGGWAVLPLLLSTLYVFCKNLTWPHQLYLAFFFLTDLVLTSEFDCICAYSTFYWMGCRGWNHCCFLCPYCHHNSTLGLHAQTTDKSFAVMVAITSAAFNCTFNLNSQVLSKVLKPALQASLVHSGSHQFPPYFNQCAFIL